MTAILARLLELIPTLIGVSLLTFILMNLAPGDPVRLKLGPEATPEAIAAENVNLGFKSYQGGTPVLAAIVEVSEGHALLASPDLTPPINPDGPDGRVAVHIGEATHPVQGEWVIGEAGQPVLRIPAPSNSDLTTGASLDLLLDRELVDNNILYRYIRWLGGIVTGDWGRSLTTDRPVTEEIFVRMPATIELAVLALFISVMTGLIVGVLSSVYARTWLDNIARFAVFIFLAMPSFWLGLEMIIVFSRYLEWFPPAGRGDGLLQINYLIMPALTLGIGSGAFLSRILRSSMLQVLNADYVRTARAKGVDTTFVVIKHALRNALIPFVTVAGLSLGALLGGTVIVETVFDWPGVGKLMIDSIRERNFPVTMGCVLVFATVFVVVNLLVDLLYVLIDPRIRLDSKGN